MIRKASLKDLDSIWQIIESAANKLVEDYGTRHWADWYTPKVILKKLETMPVFVFEDSSQVAGVYALSPKLPSYVTDPEAGLDYEPKPKSVYLNMLGVLPISQSKGLGKMLVLDSEAKARALGYDYMVFDTNAKVTHVVDFYKKLDFEVVADLEDEGDLYLFFEKSLN